MSPSKLPHATIFADAALCRKTNVGGWGAWMISRSRPSTCLGGPMKGLFPSSNEAELAALANALHAASRLGYLIEGATIMLQSDNLHALGVIRGQFGALDSPPKKNCDGVCVKPIRPKCWHDGAGKRAEPQKIRRAALLAIGRIKEDLRLTLVVRHVRGHRHNDVVAINGRAWVNRECDLLAKAGKTEALKLLEAADD